MTAALPVVTMHTDSRLQLIQDWLSDDLSLDIQSLVPASADASFRRYFRAQSERRSFVVMDAPPDKEPPGPFLHVAELLGDCDVHVPQIIAKDTERGLLLLEDLGSTPLLTALRSAAQPGPLYADALRALCSIQVRGQAASQSLPAYDGPMLRRELQLMPEWFCVRHLQMLLSDTEVQVVRAAEDFLIDNILAQPQVFVHRDYHSRNLMITERRSPGIIDFQDAVRGPVAYDLVSLLKDCYIDWPRRKVEFWVSDYAAMVRRLAGTNTQLCGSSEAEYLRWFDLAGLQRHIKVMGIFARLFWRDNKPGYLDDLPRTVAYVVEAAFRFPELRDFGLLVESRMAPRLVAANLRARECAAA